MTAARMVLFRRLDRYVIREILGPFALGFLVYTFILLLRLVFTLAEMIVRRGLSLTVVGELLALSLPNIVVLTLPMSMLFGILIAVGRLASDSELIAMRASGVSLYSLYRPILLLSLVLTLVNTFLMVRVLPWGNQRFSEALLAVNIEDPAALVEPRVFENRWSGRVLYVFEVPDRQRHWLGVFFADALAAGGSSEVTVAESGQLRLDEEGERVVLHLEGAVTHRVDLQSPDRYETTRHRSVDRVLEEAFTSTQLARQRSGGRDRKNFTIPDLLARVRDEAVPLETRNLDLHEIHKRFSIPAACLVFGLLALPLGFNNRRGGKSSGFALSIGVILGYWVVLNQGEDLARVGKLSPPLAAWLPNLVLAAVGGLLLLQRNRDRASRVLDWIGSGVAALTAALLAWQTRRRAAQRHHDERRGTTGEAPAPPATSSPAAPSADRPALRFDRPRLVFPKLLDRYILRLFVGIFLLVMLSVVSVYVIADLTENTDDILRNRIAPDIVWSYYRFLAFQIAYDLAPIAVLVSTLITFSVLSRRNEVTACRALGVSLYRLALPGLAAGLLITGLAFLLQDRILPATNEKVAQLKNTIRGREMAGTRRADRLWLVGQDRFIYNYLHYDPKLQSIQRLQVFEFDTQHRLVGRLVAERASWRDGRWILENGWARTFAPNGPATSYSPFAGERIVDLPEQPDFFETEIGRPEQMTYAELSRYVRQLRETGQPVPDLEVNLHNRIAFPAISTIMALVAMPFAFRLGRRGALYGLGVSIALGMIFLAIFAFFRTLGEAGALPPLLAVWSPNTIFALLSAYLFLDLRS
jgi:LPS export ABC transporter permease LptG/LPS export ABC transporter permease LptF